MVVIKTCSLTYTLKGQVSNFVIYCYFKREKEGGGVEGGGGNEVNEGYLQADSCFDYWTILKLQD